MYGLNIKKLLARELSLEKKNIRLMNDAVCFLSGEAFSGAARQYHRAIGLTLGTGFGTATYLEGVAQDAAPGSIPSRIALPRITFLPAGL